MEVEIPNTPLGTLRIQKVDQETKKPLSGAVFQLYDEKGNPLGSYTTNSSGTIEISRKLISGKYWLKETKAPAGYGSPSRSMKQKKKRASMVNKHYGIVSS